MTKPTIRLAIRDELPAVLALYRCLHPDDPELDVSVAGQVWSEILTSGVTTMIVAGTNGLLASSCTLAIVPTLSRGGRADRGIENVVTHPEHRRLGLGRSVLHAALDTAWKANCYKVMLATGSRRESTLRFYEGACFSRDGKTYFEMRRA